MQKLILVAIFISGCSTSETNASLSDSSKAVSCLEVTNCVTPSELKAALDAKPDLSCTVSDGGDFATIVCPDGSKTTIRPSFESTIREYWGNVNVNSEFDAWVLKNVDVINGTIHINVPSLTADNITSVDSVSINRAYVTDVSLVNLESVGTIQIFGAQITDLSNIGNSNTSVDSVTVSTPNLTDCDINNWLDGLGFVSMDYEAIYPCP